MDRLPEWSRGTPAVLVVHGPRALPVSTAVRAGDARVVFALGTRRDSLERVRSRPRVALCLLAQGVAFTAYGEARVLSEELETVRVAALELRVEEIQDHLADGRTEMLDGARWQWRDPDAAEADAKVVVELVRLAAQG